jgi:hypothetical protein
MKNQDVIYSNKILLQDGLGNMSFLSKDDSLNLELRLNKSQYGNEWSNIGDTLYYFFNETIKCKELNVSSYQYTYLMNLLDI